MNIANLIKAVHHWIFRTKKSYAQIGEDVIADFFLPQRNGFYVDVGANDPIYFNNTYFFYRKGWKGICIEPDQSRCRLLRTVRHRDIVVNEGVGTESGTLDFYVFDPDTLSTFSKDEAAEYQKLGHRLVATRQIAIRTLKEILQQYAAGQAIDLLSVDTEGWNLQALQSNDWNIFRPKVIIVEMAEYRKDIFVRDDREITQLLQQQGYLKLADTSINGIFVERSHAQSLHINQGI